MKIRYDKNNKYGEPIPKETAWKILIGIIILSVVLLIARNFGIVI